MRKFKLAFSMVLTFAVIALFSSVAFAAVTPVKNIWPSYTSPGTVKITWTNVPGATSYKVTLTPQGDADMVSTTVASGSTGFTFNNVDFDSKVLTVVVSASDDSFTTQSDATFTLNPTTDLTGTNAHQTSVAVGLPPTVDRAHSTVANPAVKQSVHGNYQNNTSSCASCHQTHTGADSNFLFKKGDICETCHDGTLGVYDVDHATAGHVSNAGYFAGQDNTMGTSEHNLGTVDISAAPGGNKTFGVSDNQNWGGEFTCDSCHQPHGSASGKLLNQDPMGWSTVEHAATGDSFYGKKYTDISIFNANAAWSNLPTEKMTATADYILVSGVIDTTKAPFKSNAKFAGLVTGDKVLMTYRWDAKKLAYVPDYSLWLPPTSHGSTLPYLYSSRAGAPAFSADNDWVAYGSGNKTTPGAKPVLEKHLADGFIAIKAADAGDFANVVGANMSFGVSVQMLVYTDSINGIPQETTVNGAYFNSKLALPGDAVDSGTAYIADSGYEMSRFCTACHTDYYSQGHSAVTGKFTTAFRHTTDGDTYTCIRCHFAHGTQPEIMKDSLDRGVGQIKNVVPGITDDAGELAYLKDETPDSAIKRYTGNAVCFGCHDLSIGADKVTLGNATSAQPGTASNAIPGVAADKANYTKVNTNFITQ